MKKAMKKVVAITLSFSVFVGSITVSAPEADAKKKTKLKINKTKCTLFVGKTTKLKVTGTKKKVKWSSSKKKVATVSQKGLVKAKKAGKTTITAKIGKKKYCCKVTVKANLVTKPDSQKATTDPNANSTQPTATPAVIKSNEELAQGLTVSTQQGQDGSMLFSVKNNNECMVPYATLTATWKTEGGYEKKKDMVIYFLGAGETFYASQASTTTYDDSQEKYVYVKNDMSSVQYSSIVVDKDYAQATDETATMEVTYEENKDVTSYDCGVSAKVYNRGTKSYTDMRFVVAYYDAAGNLISANSWELLKWSDGDPISPNGMARNAMSTPYDENTNDYYEYATYQILYKKAVNVVK